MAREYKALRVPIALLHQKVYPTSARLPPLIPLEIPKPQTKPDLGRVISPGAKIRESTTLFTVQPHLRRFFFLVDGAFRTCCRGCSEICPTVEDRANHIKCYLASTKTIERLVQAGKCVICETELVAQGCVEYSGVPVCSELCLNTWDNMSPDIFDLEHADVTVELAEFDIQSARR